MDYSITSGTALAGINYTDASGTLTFNVGETVKTVVVDTIDDGKVAATLNMTFALSNPGNAVLGWKEWATLGVFNTTVPDPSIIDDFEKGLPVPANLPTNPNGSVVFDWEQILAASPDAVPGQFPINYVLSGEYDAGASFNRLFSLPRNLTDYNALQFWYKGSNSGEPVKVTLLDGQPDPGPSGWTLAWEDEFVGADGASPDTTYWNFNIGGQGWGNNEWQYYTDSRDNSALDGSGNLVITAMPNTDPSLECAYGPGAGSPPACSYTSARLLTKDKIDFAYGRVEARIKIPYGQGIWPAFWMLGSDIDEVSWPQSGEIDILENIGKASEQSLLYGTIHGPGYSGGSGVGSGPHDTGVTLHEDFHTYAIEWEPDEIRWYFDGVQYFSATPDDIPVGREWVFDKPFFIILNVAVGGNWPGYPDETTTFPQQMTVDYVRVYQGPDNAQRFESTFVDDSSNWKLVTLPYSGFVSSATQPAGAASNTSPVLTHALGYGFEFPNVSGEFKLDDVRGVSVFDTFPDVPIDHWAVAYIERLYKAGVTSGFPDGTYRPAQAVTRGQMSIFLLKALNGPGYEPPAAAATFSDTADHWASDWIEALKASGITGGFPDGTFRPDAPVTRAQMSIFLLKALNGPGYEPPAAAATFSDTADHWASDWIEALKAAGLTSGYPDGTFRPDQAVSRAEMAVFIVNAFGLP